MKKQLLYPPLRDEFTKFGDKFEKIAHNEANGMYCYKRTTPGGLTYYEVFRAPKAKDEDGNIYHHYPSSAQFGFGTALCIRGGEKRTLYGQRIYSWTLPGKPVKNRGATPAPPPIQFQQYPT